jgi:hypothetical protein
MDWTQGRVLGPTRRPDMTDIPDFTETELWTLRTTLAERYGRPVEIQLADTEMIAGDGSNEMAWCPTVFWSAKGANFAISKIAPKRYRAIFYYHPDHQLGTGIDSYDEIGDCVVSLLQVESDHLRKHKIEADASPSEEKPADDKPDLTPNFWGD